MHHTQETTTAEIHVKYVQVRRAMQTLLLCVSSAANNFAGWSKTNHEIRQDYTDSMANNITGFIKYKRKCKKTFNIFKTPQEHLFLTWKIKILWKAINTKKTTTITTNEILPWPCMPEKEVLQMGPMEWTHTCPQAASNLLMQIVISPQATHFHSTLHGTDKSSIYLLA